MTKIQKELLEKISYITSKIVEFNIKGKKISETSYLNLMIEISHLCYYANTKKVEKVDLHKIKRIYSKVDEIIERYEK